MSPADLEHNPFFVLALPITATRMEVERTGQKLLAQLAIGAKSAKTYETPFGRFERDENAVRAALAALRDPEQRVLHELWGEGPPPDAAPGPAPPWRRSLRSIGWRAPDQAE